MLVGKVWHLIFLDLDETNDAADYQEDGGEDVEGGVGGEPGQIAEEAREEDCERAQDEEGDGTKYPYESQTSARSFPVIYPW